MTRRQVHLRTITTTAAALGATAMLMSGCGGSSGGSGNLSLVAYSTPKEVYGKLIPAFQATSAGKGVNFDQSYGASGEQSRAVASGLGADVVNFSLAPDVDRLVKAGIVDAGWASGPTKGMVTDSVVAFVVRPGNPKNIHTWADLVRPGVEVLTPNVFTSGGAKWNTMAAYGAQIKTGKTPAQARQYLADLYSHVSVQDKSAREALQTFTAGKGDVLLSYEDEAILAEKSGQKVTHVVPDQTLLIENPIAVTKNSKHAAQAKAFVDYAESAAGQAVFGAAGYRPVLPAVAAKFNFPTPKTLFTIADLGGWDTVNTTFFDPDNGVVAKIFKDRGISVGN